MALRYFVNSFLMYRSEICLLKDLTRVCQVSRKRLLIYLTNGGVIFNLILILPLFPSTMIRKTYTEDCRCGEHSAATTRRALQWLSLFPNLRERQPSSI